MRNLIIKFALWLLAKCGQSPYIIDKRALKVLEKMRPIVKDVRARYENVSGEFRRHQALARGMDAMPDVPERDLALAIELAVRE